MSNKAEKIQEAHFDRKDIGRVREIAQSQLTKLGRAVGFACEEVYVFRENYWCGMRFTLGTLRAEWMLGSEVISFYREYSLIKEVPFATGTRLRSAA